MGRTRKYKRYSPEFKREVLKRASGDGITDKQVCEGLGIQSNLLEKIIINHVVLLAEAFVYWFSQE